MILSVSERCDIVAFYMEWFCNRLQAGFLDVRNPFYPKQVSRIVLDKEHIEAIVFCTKNPEPLYKRIKEIPYPFILHVTITPYLNDIEPFVPDKKKTIAIVKKISQEIGKDRVIIRYDPIFISPKYNIDYHKKMFTRLCEEIDGYTNRIIISFVDLKRNTLKNRKILNMEPLTKEKIEDLASFMGKVAAKNHLLITTCAENLPLEKFGFQNVPCTPEASIQKLLNNHKKYRQNRTRENCSCIDMVDIGNYNVCHHFCRYCYANYDESQVLINEKQHDPTSSLLIGHLTSKDIIKEKV
jgi:hypothetical protein